jgi:hypothetical protein
MLGSSSAGASGALGVGVGVDCVTLDMPLRASGAPLGEGLVIFGLARRRSSTASTTPTTPTSSAVAVAVAVTTTRVVLPTCVTLPTRPDRIRASDG